MSNEYTFQTNLLHNKHKVDPATGAVSVPIQHASTFHQSDIDTFGKYDYARSGNPTREALEEVIAELEEGCKRFCLFIWNGCHFNSFPAYFPRMTMSSLQKMSMAEHSVWYLQVLVRFGISHTFVDMTDLEAVKKAIQPNTKLFYVETPSNPTLKVTDIKAVSEIAKEHDALTFVDNTFLTPALQKPLTLGADIVLHSATKFLSGHSDVIAGLAVVKDPELCEKLYFLQNSFGAVLGVQDAWLVLRGLKTLHVRLEHSVKVCCKTSRLFQRTSA